MKTGKFLFFIITSVILLAGTETVHAQKDFPHDTSYYETFPHKMTGRVFLSQKYIHLNFPALGNAAEMEYKANAKLNLGIGVTFNHFSINVFNGFAFLNKNNKDKGKTKGLDAQLHLYPRKWAIDLLVLFPKGFYLDPKGYASANANTYYYRPDINFTLLGLSTYRVPNKQKFSYRAAIVQSEWQKKSAGSILYGGQAYYGSIKGDSALVPTKVQNNFSQAGITKINFVSVGPGIGYAYTLVIDKHFFITGSLVANLDINFTNEEGTSKNSKVSLNQGEVFKTALGYNSSNWNFSVNWTGSGLWFKGASTTENYFWPTGNYKIVIAKKFSIKKSH